MPADRLQECLRTQEGPREEGGCLLDGKPGREGVDGSSEGKLGVLSTRFSMSWHGLVHSSSHDSSLVAQMVKRLPAMRETWV